PKEIWFDNMSTAVAQIKKGKERKLTDRFIQFMAHYGFKSKFCNPASGNEKGHVENKVGYIRRNLFVPIPAFDSLNDFNKELLIKCEDDSNRNHYKKNQNISDLFKVDSLEMIPLNSYPFEIYKLQKYKSNKVGFVKFENNEYSVLPNFLGVEVWLKIFVDKIEILDNNYKLLTSHRRIYKKNIKSTNWKDWLKVLERKIAALEYTDFYHELPEIWKTYFKSKDSVEKRKIVSALSEMLIIGDLNTATKALKSNLDKGIGDISSLITTFRAFNEPNKIYIDLKPDEINTPYQSSMEPELSIYDALIGGY
ncbi:MAG: Mu transposase domain-containing protein, partial [Cetobacterium sp.]